ncbi:MAG: flagellar type III secretion system pore protein FliP [bacterium]
MSFGASLGILLSLAFVLVLLGAALQLLKRFAPGATGGRGRLPMQIVQRLSLGPKQGIAVVQIGSRYVAVTVGEGGVNRLFQLNDQDIAAIERPEPAAANTIAPAFRTAFTAAVRGLGLPIGTAIVITLLSATLATAQQPAAPVTRRITPPATAPTVPAVAAPAVKVTPQATTATAAKTSAAAAAKTQAPAGKGAAVFATKAVPATPIISKAGDLAIAKLVPQMDVRVGGDKGDGFHLSGTVGIVVMMGLLTLLPTLLLMMTSFTRILIVLHFLRTALATQNAPPANLVAAMALMLTGFVMAPTLTAVNRDALQPWMNGEIEQSVMLERGVQPFRAFMLRQTRDHDLQVFVELSKGVRPKTVAEVPLITLMSAFVTSELRTSFQIGFALFLPFIIIDVVVSSVLMSMGMFMLPPAMISLPFKLLLFVLVDGWTLIVQSLVASFK